MSPGDASAITLILSSSAYAAMLHDDSRAPGRGASVEPGSWAEAWVPRRMQAFLQNKKKKTGIAGCLRSCPIIAGHRSHRCPLRPPSRVGALFHAPSVHPACLAFLEERSDFPKLKKESLIRGSSLSLLTFFVLSPGI